MVTLAIILLSLLLNALLSCVEMAFVSVSRPEVRRLATQGDASAQRLLKLRDSPERTLSVLQVGITLVGAISAAVGGAGADESIAPYLESQFGLSEATAETIGVAIVVVPLTYLSVVVGELVPKTLALRNPTQLALNSSFWLLAFDTFLAPVVWFLEKSTQVVLKIVPGSAIKPTNANEVGSVELDSLSGIQRQYVLNMARLSNRAIEQIALPWDKVDKVDESQSIEDIHTKILACGHTRLPVTSGEIEIGLLHAKEFFALEATGRSDWKTMIRGVLHVNHTDSIFSVMKLMQNTKNHMSLVVDQSSQKLVGIVTLEDIFEEVIGEIYDEDDDGRALKILLSSPKFRLS
jgi:putative hemolysin